MVANKSHVSCTKTFATPPQNPCGRRHKFTKYMYVFILYICKVATTVVVACIWAALAQFSKMWPRFGGLLLAMASNKSQEWQATWHNLSQTNDHNKPWHEIERDLKKKGTRNRHRNRNRNRHRFCENRGIERGDESRSIRVSLEFKKAWQVARLA